MVYLASFCFSAIKNQKYILSMLLEQAQTMPKQKRTFLLIFFIFHLEYFTRKKSLRKFAVKIARKLYFYKMATGINL